MTSANATKKTTRRLTRNEVVERAIRDVLQGGDRDRELSPEEYRRFLKYVEELRVLASGVEPGTPTGTTMERLSGLDGEIWRLDYHTKPPNIRQFVLDDYYLGKTLRPIQGENEGIWPAWLELFERDLDLQSYIHNMVITGSLGIGKCQREGDSVMLYDGTSRQVQDLKAGDRLMGDDSGARTIACVSSGTDDLYEIRPVKGEPFHVNAAHVLCLVHTNTDRIIEISVADYLAFPKWRQAVYKLYRVPLTFAERTVPLDPYWFGLWLGDGNSDCPSITSADPEIVRYHRHYAASFGLHSRPWKNQNTGKARVYPASNEDKGRHVVNPILEHLRALNLVDNKHIPSVYKVNSAEIRRAVLAGLIDTDGDHAINGCYALTLVNRCLAEDTVWLARSLGYAASVKPKNRSIKKTDFTGTYWHVSISGAHDLPCKLRRKQSQPRRQRKNVLRTGFSVKPLGRGRYYGFTLDGNGRYLLPDFTVTHNTWMMVVAMLYRICIATHLKNPQHFFGISRGSRIIYNFLSVTKEAVKDTAFGDATNFMGDSPYFLEVCKFNPDLEYSGFRIPMKNKLHDDRESNIWITAGSKGQHIIGRNVVGAGLDEGNFRLEKDPDLKAYALYDSVRTRISNRFQKLSTFLPALCVIASSASDESSFTEKVVTEIEAQNQRLDEENAKLPEGHKIPRTQLVYRNAVYKIKRHALTEITLDHDWFRVAYGLKNMEPFILNGWYKEDGRLVDEGHEEPPSGARTELVPKLYYEAFRRNCRTNLQSLSGISTGGAHRLFPSTLDIEWCLEQSAGEGLQNPVKAGVTHISLSNEDKANIWDFLQHKTFVTRMASRYLPVRHPERMRYAHIDLATQTLAGVAVCHLVGAQTVHDFKDGLPFAEARLIVEYDFILTICAGQTKPISLDKIQRFFFWLRDTCGFRFKLITADQWQSEMPLQMLEAKGFEVAKLSIDKDKSVYTAWRAGFEEHRIRLSRNDQMMREAEALLEMDKKFDHPPEGSKDTTDAASGAYYNAVSSDEKLSIGSYNQPNVYTGQQIDAQQAAPPPIDIPLPAKGYDRSKVFEA